MTKYFHNYPTPISFWLPPPTLPHPKQLLLLLLLQLLLLSPPLLLTTNIAATSKQQNSIVVSNGILLYKDRPPSGNNKQKLIVRSGILFVSQRGLYMQSTGEVILQHRIWNWQPVRSFFNAPYGSSTFLSPAS